MKKKNLIIFGNGKHADTILCEINFSKYDLLGFVIDRDNEYLLTNKNEKISLDKVLNKKTYAFIAVGNNKTRKKIFNNFQKFKNLQWISIISKNSFIQKKVTVGLGTIIMPGVVMCEIAAQLSSYICTKYDFLGADIVGLGGLEEIRFRNVVRPGDRFVVMLRQEKVRFGAMIICYFQGYVNQSLVVDGKIKGIPLPTDALRNVEG